MLLKVESVFESSLFSIHQYLYSEYQVLYQIHLVLVLCTRVQCTIVLALRVRCTTVPQPCLNKSYVLYVSTTVPGTCSTVVEYNSASCDMRRILDAACYDKIRPMLRLLLSVGTAVFFWTQTK